MKKKHLLKPILTTLLVGIFIFLTSCEDDFSEKDFLETQYQLAEQKSAADHARDLAIIAANAQRELANIMAQGANDLALAAAQSQYAQELALLQQQIAQETREEFLEAYRNAGLLVNANIVILDAVTNQAIGGAAVKLFGKDGTTSNQGVANFEDIPIGGGDVQITATNYYTATSPAIIPYVEPAVAGNNGLPIQRTISATLNMVANGSVTNSSVTVTGKVTLDKDLTNATAEFPSSAKVEIDYAAALTPNANSNGIQFTSYQLDNPDFQPADVDATTGEYTIVVPAISGVKLILPVLEEEITYIELNPAYNATTNPDVDKYLLKKEMGTFNVNASDSHAYHDANATTTDLYEYKFDPLKGSGFDLNFTQLFDDLYNTYYPYTGNNHSGYQFTFTPGDSYTSIPQVALVANGTDDIKDDKVLLNALVTLGNLNFTGGVPANIPDNTYNVKAHFTYYGSSYTLVVGTVETEVNGSVIDYKNISTYNGLSNYPIRSIEKYTLDGIASANQPTISAEFSAVTIHSISIQQGASKGEYTSWPTVTFTGGSPSTNASFTMDSNRSSKWEVSIANAGSDYDIFPEIKYTNTLGTESILYDENSNEYKDNLILNTGGTISLSNTNLKTWYMRPSEIATIVEGKLLENSGTQLDVSFTTNTNKDNDISGIGSIYGNWKYSYTTKPNHAMVKKYNWVTDATTPLELDVVYYNNVAPLSATIVAGTGKGYMNPKPQTATSNPLTISSNNSGQTITRDFKYGVGKIE